MRSSLWARASLRHSAQGRLSLVLQLEGLQRASGAQPRVIPIYICDAEREIESLRRAILERHQVNWDSQAAEFGVPWDSAWSAVPPLLTAPISCEELVLPMNPNQWLARFGRFLVVAFAVLLFGASASAEWKEKVLYSFQGGSDGQTPAGGVAFDKAGNIYGVTHEGGSTCPSPGCGTIFQLSPGKGGAWTETLLYGFNGTQGSYPEGSVIIDAHGNLYGTTSIGGNGQCKLFGYVVGCGVVYELSPPTQKSGQWSYAVLYSFQGGNDGLFPVGDLVFDKQGNLYGATWYGGGKGTTCDQYYGGNCGTVFKLSPPKQKGRAWAEKILHSFAGGTAGKQFGDGAQPNGGLVLDSQGAIYGTTYFGGNEAGGCDGGSGGTGCGVVFKLAPPTKKGGAWSEQVLHRFVGPDGASPAAGVILDRSGNLYGTAFSGGNNGNGSVFELRKLTGGSGTWREKALYLFNDGNDGSGPMGSLLFGAHGDLYGTTAVATNRNAQGNVFRMKPPFGNAGAWDFSVLHTFAGTPDGAYAAANLVCGADGGLFGSTQQGGTGTDCAYGGCGTVFEVSP